LKDKIVIQVFFIDISVCMTSTLLFLLNSLHNFLNAHYPKLGGICEHCLNSIVIKQLSIKRQKVNQKFFKK